MRSDAVRRKGGGREAKKKKSQYVKLEKKCQGHRERFPNFAFDNLNGGNIGKDVVQVVRNGLEGRIGMDISSSQFLPNCS